MTNFTDIEYLKVGNERQRLAYCILNELSIFDKLIRYKPILTGTIPIGIDLPESDLDIICERYEHTEFAKTLSSLFAFKEGFEIRTKICNGLLSTIATFKARKFKIEIFGQDCPTEKQNAYKHRKLNIRF